MRMLIYTKEAILSRKRYALKKERENDTISLLELQKRIRLQRKRELRQVELEEMESQFFSQSIIGMSCNQCLEE